MIAHRHHPTAELSSLDLQHRRVERSRSAGDDWCLGHLGHHCCAVHESLVSQASSDE
jgi:hypothetical protein